MSPVFRHGGLRLYLLKLLDEAPRHGYDVIRLLQDKFLGVYSPSPGTIYPRLARLEEEGLVTHETVDGKKVYRITDAGRAELHRRLDDLADLEDELAASVRDIAKEISRDVRETVRNLRDELTWAVREAGRTPDPAAVSDAPDAAAWRESTADNRKTPQSETAEADADASRDASDEGKAGATPPGARRRDRSDWREWRDFADWAKHQGWGDWIGKQDWQDWRGWAKSGHAEWGQSARPDWIKGGRARDRQDAGPDLVSGLEHLATAFSREIRGVARQADNLSDDALGNLGRILSDALNRIRSEVFRPSDQPSADATSTTSTGDSPTEKDSPGTGS